MNVSPATLLTPDCGELLGRLPLARVLLELSEHDQVEDYVALNAALAPFRAAGLRLAIDDVGAGFSSLRHIVVTAPDVIKIDRSIVTGLNSDPVLTKLVQSLVEFGHGCRFRVVAEGVETAGEVAALRTLGVDYGQGWHFGRPGPPEALSGTQVLVPSPRVPGGELLALLTVPVRGTETGASGHYWIATHLPGGNRSSWPIRVLQRIRTRATSATTGGPTRWVPTWPPPASSSS